MDAMARIEDAPEWDQFLLFGCHKREIFLLHNSFSSVCMSIFFLAWVYRVWQWQSFTIHMLFWKYVLVCLSSCWTVQKYIGKLASLCSYKDIILVITLVQSVPGLWMSISFLSVCGPRAPSVDREVYMRINLQPSCQNNPAICHSRLVSGSKNVSNSVARYTLFNCALVTFGWQKLGDWWHGLLLALTFSRESDLNKL